MSKHAPVSPGDEDNIGGPSHRPSLSSHLTYTVGKDALTATARDWYSATAYATLIEALRSEGKYREGNRIGRQMLAEGQSDFAKTIALYEMAYNLAELEEELDQALQLAHQSLELAPEELKQFPLAALGWVHYKRREFDQARTTLAARGMAIEQQNHGIAHSIYFHDPDGHEIEITTYEV